MYYENIKKNSETVETVRGIYPHINTNLRAKVKKYLIELENKEFQCLASIHLN